jgi:hypothetical protein
MYIKDKWSKKERKQISQNKSFTEQSFTE